MSECALVEAHRLLRSDEPTSIMARMPAFMKSDSVGQASTTRLRFGSILEELSWYVAEWMATAL